jgi:hypothetical protein
MGEVPTPCERRDLQALARRFRASAADTVQMDYVGLFLSAALALEARAQGARTGMVEFDHHIHAHH